MTLGAISGLHGRARVGEPKTPHRKARFRGVACERRATTSRESTVDLGGEHMMTWPNKNKQWAIGIVVSVVGIAVAIYFSPSNSLTNVANTGVFINQGHGNVVNNLPRQYFSSTERVILAPEFLGGHNTLNLDNIATLTARWADHIIMILDDVAAVPVIQGSNVFKMSTSNNPTYRFDGKQVRHEIEVGGRTFIVTLKTINNINIPEVANPREYVFGISEK
jgi:hypothetical protein